MRAAMLGVAMACLAGCSSGAAKVPASAQVPAEFSAGCGHPGASIVVMKVPVTVKHRDCDLTGVTVQVGVNGTGAVVPNRGEQVAGQGDVASGYPPPAGINISVDATTGDVTVSSY